ncbi:hypothetical protein [Halobellus rubicundus]|uniref:DUF8081 domain-containing protein n=1 Tax=Halobellus rubicundus TaxID=2996466 RepID=A0ABD5MBE7_9EURY
MSEYVVDVKPSARRTNGAVGRLIQQAGSRHRFDGRADAEAWAAGLSAQGESTVWIRTANPDDRSDADAYLIGRRSWGVGSDSGASSDVAPDSGSEQAALDGDARS